MTAPPPVMTSWAEVTSLQLQSPQSDTVVAFAIDNPRAGDHSLGAGLEINGWVIGHRLPVQGVRTVKSGRHCRLNQLDVRRPDVAADYPAFAHAVSSGFSAWAPIDPHQDRWHIAVEAVLANGDAVTLAEIAGRSGIKERETLAGARLVTAPDFVIIGAQRGGTTSLHAYLSAHPQIQTASTKELHYITDCFERGRDWYLGQFPADLPPGTLTGEATPYALFHPLAPERLQQIAPKAKLIALLRNPADRAYSHYRLERSRGFEPLDFPAALDAEADRLAGEEGKLASDPTYISEPHKHASYLARGDYAPQFERWLARFPRERLLVLRSEDLYARTAETFARVAKALEIAPGVDIPFATHNRGEGPALDPAIRRRLSEHFAPKNARLMELLGWEPGWK